MVTSLEPTVIHSCSDIPDGSCISIGLKAAPCTLYDAMLRPLLILKRLRGGFLLKRCWCVFASAVEAAIHIQVSVTEKVSRAAITDWPAKAIVAGFSLGRNPRRGFQGPDPAACL